MKNVSRKILRGGGTYVLALLCIFMICSLLYCFFRNDSIVKNNMSEILVDEEKMDIYEEQMYETCVQKLLSEKLYNARDAYDAGNYLMVPLYYAFQSQNREYIQMFQEHMESFALLSEDEKENFRGLSMLDRLQYLYLASEYMCLCTENEMTVLESLFSFAYEETEELALTYTGACTGLVQYQNFWELLDGLLSGEGYGNGKSFDHIITDIDLFLLTVFCDLKYIYENNIVGEVDVNEEIFSRAENYVDRIFRLQVTWYEDGTWQLQPGAWRDYPDCIYAGISDPDEIKEGMDYRVEDCTWDSGHFRRIPLFLRSYQRAAHGKEDKEYYRELLDGVGTTFVKNVLVAPDEECKYYRMKNYMDGCNGLYRYGYNQAGVGIGPYQDSVCFLLGWYAFCGNDVISEAYRITALKFPLDAEGREIYTDPTTIREQNPIFLSEQYRQFICYLAGRLKT